VLADRGQETWRLCPVETAWLISSAMLMPLERMRVGISSESASHTHTPGPMAKNAMNTKRVMATFHPLCWLGTGVISALSILQRSLARGIEIGEGIRKKRDHFVGGHAAFAGDLDRLGGGIVGTRTLVAA
jgi:hypothetical protein